MKVLTETRAIQIIREEWQNKLDKLREESEIHLKPGGSLKGKSIISVGTDVKGVKSGIIYTVKEITEDGHVFILEKPDGGIVRIPREKLEGKGFVLP